jgi:16S rRNA (uracil1498-N3)-methyltransferase
MTQLPSPPDFDAPRLFVAFPLAAGTVIPLDRAQSNYLGNVLRLGPRGAVLVFNGRDGEWRGEIVGRKKPEALQIALQTRPQAPLPDVTYAFAPLKHARLDYMVQKAAEMGVGTLQPVLTRHTQVHRLNLDRMRANVIEAAEQCGILGISEVHEPAALDKWLANRPEGRLLVFCDERAEIADPAAALRMQEAASGLDVLIGPEGGFSADERALLHRQPKVCILSLGPRILRADTAAVAALALIQATIGDWR